jgi:hypothetical protein
MTNTDQIIEFLEEQERGMCDDCLSDRLRITPRQQVNAICRRLQSDGLISRSKKICPSCSSIKLINCLGAAQPSRPRPHRREAPSQRGPSAPAVVVPSIEEIRNHIIRFCRELWRATARAEVPSGASVISALRDKGTVPAHEANMMHTLCALRNCYSYEQLAMGPKEMAVVQGAWSIVEDWASSVHGDLWHPTSRSSGAS